MKLLKIKWIDHTTFTNAAWRDRKFVEKELTPVHITTVGWLLKETEDYYLLASTKSDDSSMKHEFLILKGTVKKVKEL